MHKAPSPARGHFWILSLALGVTAALWLGLYWYFGLIADEYLGRKVELLLIANGVPEKDILSTLICGSAASIRQMNITLKDKHSFNAIYHGLVLISAKAGAPFRHERLSRRGMTFRIDSNNGFENIRLQLTYR